MGFFRSDEMREGTLVLPSDRARVFLDVLGRKARVEIEDTPASSSGGGKRPYRRYVQRLEEMERILRFLFDEIAAHEMQTIKRDPEGFLEHDSAYSLDPLEAQIKKVYEQFSKFKENNSTLQAEKNQAAEERYVATAAAAAYSGHGSGLGSTSVGSLPTGGAGGSEHARQSLLPSRVGAATDTSAAEMGFSTLAGVVPQSDQERLARTIFRTTRGNTFTHFQQIPETMHDPKTGIKIAKSIFVVYYQGRPGSALYERLTRICNGFNVPTYPYPTSGQEAYQRKEELDQTIHDKYQALDAFEQFVSSEIRDLIEVPSSNDARSSRIEEWRLFCAKEKSLYATLNKFEGDITLRAKCWFPTSEEDLVRHLLLSLSTKQQASAFLLTDARKSAVGGSHAGDSKQSPPTYIRRTAVTWPFQELVDTYGTPRYGEANPALFAIVFFPFLFGIMYGDIGHGLCVLLFGLYLVVKNDELKVGTSALKVMLPARYMFLFMGIFAFYAGWIYNDFLSLALPLFPSYFNTAAVDAAQGTGVSTLQLQPLSHPVVYPFGLDWAWKETVNELLFLNSFKMKFAVIVGVSQMLFGLFLKASNAIHFRQWLELVFEFIPQLTILVCLFGYLDGLIVFKWVTPGVLQGHPENNKPSLISAIIGMGLGPMKGFGIPKDEIMYQGQEAWQPLLMTITAISIPMLLLPKPLILLALSKRKTPRTVHYSSTAQNPSTLHGEDSGPGGPFDDDDDDIQEEEEFNFTEEMIHQLIETIEFILGTISNTASYLRLWALSLAHQQLALVFFQKTVLIVLGMESAFLRPFALVIAFAIFAVVTFGILLMMDSMECFLHSLRLQWVEFQGKFYKGDGRPFAPFSHRDLLLSGEVVDS